MSKYICKVCGYVHEGETAPSICSVCKAPQSEFEPVKEKKGFFSDTSSNGYTIFYAAVMVTIVAAVLAFTALSLKDRQQKNVRIDKKIQILAALQVAATAVDAESLYEQYVKEDVILDAKGNEAAKGGFNIDIAAEVKKAAGERLLPLYKCKKGDTALFVIPVYGAGLWGPIWGYVCLNGDRNSIYGAYFSHKGETPGLGAEIDKPMFQHPFVGKQLIKNGEFKSIAVMKTGQKALNNEDQVDAISGGTITSKGVEAMLLNSLQPYVPFLLAGEAGASAAVPACCAGH